MLVIRLNRTGRKNRANFRVAVQEKTVAPGGRHVEMLGSWDPHKKLAVLKNERILYWLSKGAQPSRTVHNLLISQGVLEGEKRAISMKRPVKEEASSELEATDAEKKEDVAKVEISESEEKAEQKVEKEEAEK